MAALLVIYDLNTVGQNYKCITETMETYPTRWRFQKSAWVIQTNETEEAVATKLMACLDGNDLLFITRIAETAAWAGYTDDGSGWLGGVI